MNSVVIIPSKISGKIIAPPSKSITHRALVLASLAQGSSVINDALICDDTVRTINGCRKFGAKIKVANNRIIITGTAGKPASFNKEQTINVGLSGTSMRFLTALAAISKGPAIIDGRAGLRKRPMKDLVDALKLLRVNISGTGEDEHLPIKVEGGKIIGGDLSLSGESSSQFISALLMIAPITENGLTIGVKSPHSSPYINLTCSIMKSFGIAVKRNNLNVFQVHGNQTSIGRKFKVEGDFSSASYFFAAAAITKSKVTVTNLCSDSRQADRYFLEILEKMGCSVVWNKHKVSVMGKVLNGININLGNCPDIVPTLAVVASFAKGITNITNIGHLRFKESDRLNSLTTELSKMGVKVSTGTDSLSIRGGRVHDAEIDPHHDHRIAMSMAIAGLAALGKTVIKNPEVVNKSYPNFFKDLKKLGANMRRIT